MSPYVPQSSSEGVFGGQLNVIASFESSIVVVIELVMALRTLWGEVRLVG